jgi:molybdopterin converting factor small subunit
MKIKLKLNSLLQPYVLNLAELPPEGELWEVKDGATINDILGMIKFPEGPKVVTLLNNMMTKDWDTPLKDGDKLLLTPLAGGGSL